MITEIHLQNWQGHADTKIKLSAGVNVIVGPSNVGKSSIYRAVWWVARNRPSGAGDNYRHNDAPKKEPTAVTLTFSNGDSVCRFKQGSKNGYLVNGEELVAVRSDVPTEVSEILQLADHNLQPQHLGYFLIADGPGEVAQKLNDVAGLDMIDVCVKNASTLAGRNQQDTSVCRTRIAELNGDIKQFNDIADRDEAVTVVEALDRKVQVLDDDIEFMENTIGQLEKLKEELDELAEFLKVEDRVAPLLDLAKEIATLDDDINYLETAIETGIRLRTERTGLEAKVKDLETDFHRLLKDRGACPLCKQEMQK